MLQSSRGNVPSSWLEWRESARRLPRLPNELGSGPVRLLPCSRSSCSSERLPSGGGRPPTSLLRARERYSRSVRLSQMSSGMTPYRALAPRERYRIELRLAMASTTGPSSWLE
eukprot:scaffold98791_cov43-Phaeocystis_antarctica.AAC.2